MKLNILMVLGFIIVFSSCSEKQNTSAETKAKIFAELFGQEAIESEFFKINTKTDTLLTSRAGTKYRIYANSFAIAPTDSTQYIQLEIKEAFKPLEFVMGNLTTRSNGKILSSDGMLFINAYINNKSVPLKDGKEIGIIVPTLALDEEMQLFEGVQDSTSINWINEQNLLNKKLKKLEKSYRTITYQFDYIAEFDHPDFTKWLWSRKRKIGDKITFQEANVEILAISTDSVKLQESQNGLFIPEVITKKGENGFVEDFNTSYLFTVKKLGWANIDKFYNDPNAEEVALDLKVKNEDFSYVFTSLLLPNKNIYINGYQKMDGTYGFTQRDEEALILSIGEKAYILATAYLKDTPYFDLIEFEIKTTNNITLELKQTTAKELKHNLAKQIN